MQTINYEKVPTNPDGSKIKFLLLKVVLTGSSMLLMFGGIIYLAVPQSISKTNPEEPVKRGDGRRDLQTPTQPSEPPLVITKKPQKPIVIEEGSDAWFCLQNNGGSNCSTRDRFAPKFKVITPGQEKTYEDYLIQYGVRESGGCDRYFNGEPNC